MKVVGKKIGSFTNDKGEVVNFAQLHCVADFEQSNFGTEGQEVIVVKLKPDEVADIPLNAEIDVIYNRYGRVQRVDVIS